MEYIKNLIKLLPSRSEWLLAIKEWYNLIAEHATISLIGLVVFILILFFLRNK